MDLFEDTSSESYRHECEVRWVATKPLAERRKYLMLVDDKRGLQARLRLQEGLERLWQTRKKQSK